MGKPFRTSIFPSNTVRLNHIVNGRVDSIEFLGLSNRGYLSAEPNARCCLNLTGHFELSKSNSGSNFVRLAVMESMLYMTLTALRLRMLLLLVFALSCLLEASGR